MQVKMKPGVFAIVVILLLAFIVISPLIFIWSLNTLFGLTIAYGFFEWLAALLLLGTLNSNRAKFGSSD